MEGVHGASGIRLTLDYGSHSEAYEGRFRSDDRIEGFLVRGTVEQSIAALELRRIALGPEDAASAAIPAGGDIMRGR